MRRSPFRTLTMLVGVGLLFATTSAAAQQPTRPAQPDTSGFSQAMGMMTQMGPMYQTMMLAMMEGTLKALEQQQVIDRMAAITRRYYEALMKQGFTKEEALQIVAGMKLLPTQPGR
jgi:hypothetical protein